MVLEAVKWTFGFSTMQAAEYIKTAPQPLIERIVKSYKAQSHPGFYED